VTPDGSDGTYYSSTYGSTDAFEYGNGNQFGSFGTDRVFKIDTSADPVGVSASFKVSGTFNTVFYIREGASCGSASSVAYNDDGCGLANGGSCITMKLKPNTVYWLIVDGWGTNKGDFVLDVDYTTLCADCSCDASYGENTTNDPVDCRDQSDYCGNYRDITVGAKPFNRAYSDNLSNDLDDFNHWGSYGTYYNCSDHNCLNGGTDESCYAPPPRHGSSDKIYRLKLATASNVIIRVQRTSGWSSGYNPRFYVWQGDVCPGSSDKRICLGNGNSWLQWGDGGCGTTCGSTAGHPPAGYGYPAQGVRTFAAGTYWIIVDVWQGYGSTGGTIGTGAYKLSVTVW